LGPKNVWTPKEYVRFDSEHGSNDIVPLGQTPEGP